MLFHVFQNGHERKETASISPIIGVLGIFLLNIFQTMFTVTFPDW